MVWIGVAIGALGLGAKDCAAMLLPEGLTPEVFIYIVYGVAVLGVAWLVGVAPPWKEAAGGPLGRLDRIIFGSNLL